MNTTTTPCEFWCWICLDFEYLPGIGPCPDCRPDAYTEHVMAWIDTHDTERTDVA